jgi:hypothetical protein
MSSQTGTLTVPAIPACIRQVVLHVGMPRTGSTFIQNACERNRRALLAQGILYPSAGHVRETGARDFRTSGHNAWWLDGLLRGKAEPLEAVWREADDSAGVHTVLLSSEELFFAMGPNELARIAAALPASLTRVAVYLRRQDEWLESMYAEAVTGGYFKLTMPVDEFVAQCEGSATGVPPVWADGDLDYFGWLDRLRTHFGEQNIHVRSFESAPSGPPLFTDFMDLCALHVDGLEIPGDMRASNAAFLDREGLEIVRFLNRLPFEDHQHYSRFIAKLQEARGTPAAKPLLLDAAARRRILDRYADSNAKVAREFLGNRNGILFGDRLPDGDPGDPRISPSALHSAYLLYLETRKG